MGDTDSKPDVALFLPTALGERPLFSKRADRAERPAYAEQLFKTVQKVNDLIVTADIVLALAPNLGWARKYMYTGFTASASTGTDYSHVNFEAGGTKDEELHGVTVRVVRVCAWVSWRDGWCIGRWLRWSVFHA